MGWWWHSSPVSLRRNRTLVYSVCRQVFLSASLCISVFSSSVSASVACLLSVLVVRHFAASLSSFHSLGHNFSCLLNNMWRTDSLWFEWASKQWNERKREIPSEWWKVTGRDGEETHIQMFPSLSAWFTFPWSYKDWYSENDTADRRSGCRENVALHNAVMMIVMEKW